MKHSKINILGRGGGNGPLIPSLGSAPDAFAVINASFGMCVPRLDSRLIACVRKKALNAWILMNTHYLLSESGPLGLVARASPKSLFLHCSLIRHYSPTSII